MKIIKMAGLLVLLLFVIVFPMLFSNPAVTTIAVFTLMFAAATTGWNIFSGYSGYIALGHGAYFGLGAYTLAIMCQRWNIPGGYFPFLLVPVAGLVAAAFSVVLGWIALRVRRHTFVVITIAMFFILQLLAYNLKGLTNGSTGLGLPIPTDWSGDFFNILLCNPGHFAHCYRHLMVGAQFEIWTGAAGDPRRRGPGAGPWCKDRTIQTLCFCDLRADRGHGGGHMGLFRRVDLSAHCF